MEIIKINNNKKRYIDLLLLGDEQESMIDKYIDKGDMFVLKSNNAVIAQCVVTNYKNGVYEIKNIAVNTANQKMGYGKCLINYVFNYYNDLKTIYVGTGDSVLTVPFYIKCGFKESHRIKDFFIDNYDKPIFECGKQLVDMVYFYKDKI